MDILILVIFSTNIPKYAIQVILISTNDGLLCVVPFAVVADVAGVYSPSRAHITASAKLACIRAQGPECTLYTVQCAHTQHSTFNKYAGENFLMRQKINSIKWRRRAYKCNFVLRRRNFATFPYFLFIFCIVLLTLMQRCMRLCQPNGTFTLA